jgi:thymidylate kinase
MYKYRFSNINATALSKLNSFYNTEKLIVVIDGKPSSGKTTAAEKVVSLLKESSIKAVDVKHETLEALRNKQVYEMLNMLERSDGNALLSSLSMVKHAASYLADLHMLEQFKKSGYRVIILQRLPSDFAFMLNSIINYGAMLRVEEYLQQYFEHLINPDIVFYLYAPNGVLEVRNANRTNGRDLMHLHLINTDDAWYIEYLDKKYKDKFKKIDSNRKPEEVAADLALCIKAALR